MVKLKQPRRRKARDTLASDSDKGVQLSRYEFFRAFYKYRYPGADLCGVSPRAFDKAVANALKMDARSVGNVRLGSRNLSGEKADKLRRLLGPASVHIDPAVLTFNNKK